MSKEEKLLLKLNSIYFLSTSIAGIFFNLFLFQHGGLSSVIYFGFTSLSTLFLVYALSGYFLKKISSKDSIRLGLFFHAILYLLILFLQRDSVGQLFTLGLINGLATGFYWVGINITEYIATHDHSRNEFFGKRNFYSNLGAFLGPIIGGLIIYLFKIFSIQVYGYSALFLTVSILFFMIFIITKNLPFHKSPEFKFEHILTHRRLKKWKIALLQNFLYGLFDISLGTLATVLMFLILKKEFTLGLVSSVSVLLYAFASLVAYKALIKNPKLYFLGCLGNALGIYVFATQQNWIGIISLAVVANIAAAFLNITAFKFSLDVIDHVKEDWRKKYHFLIEKDIAVGIGRIFTYFVLMVMFRFQAHEEVAKNWLVVISIFPVIIGSMLLYKDFYFNET